MIPDLQTTLASGQAAVITAGSSILTNVWRAGELYTGNGGVDLGAIGMKPIYSVFHVTSSFVAASTDGTVTLTLESSGVEAMTSSTVHLAAETFTEAQLAAGLIVIRRLHPGQTWLEYVAGRLAGATQNFTTGGIFDWRITDNINDYKQFASALNFV